jgi:hypothetical protein
MTPTRSESASASSWSWGHEHERDARLGLQALELALHLAAQLEVERRQGLVEEQHLRRGRERAGEGHALLLAARQLVRQAVSERVEPHERQHPLHRRADLGPRTAQHLQPEGHVAGHREVREEGVGLEDRVGAPAVRRQARDVLPADPHAPPVRRLEARDEAQERGLAAARGAQEREELARANGQRHVVHGAHGAEVPPHALDADRPHGPGCWPGGRPLASRQARPARAPASPNRGRSGASGAHADRAERDGGRGGPRGRPGARPAL